MTTLLQLGVYAKPLNERLIILLRKKNVIWACNFKLEYPKYPRLILSAIVAPFASAGIPPVANQLNQDSTVY